MPRIVDSLNQTLGYYSLELSPRWRGPAITLIAMVWFEPLFVGPSSSLVKGIEPRPEDTRVLQRTVTLGRWRPREKSGPEVVGSNPTGPTIIAS